MTHVITSLCLRDDGCSNVCPVDCIRPGESTEYPTHYIDSGTCIDCGACVPECPYNAIFSIDAVPSAYRAKGGEYINEIGLTGSCQITDSRKQKITLNTVRQLAAGETIDLRGAIKTNAAFFS